MRKLIAIGLSPNTFPQDVKLAGGLLFQPWRWQKRAEGQQDGLWLFESGRSALLTLLKALDIGQGDEVLIQAFTCVAVPNPVLWAGAQPIYVDIDKQTLNFDLKDLRRKVTSRSRAIVVQHTFGLPAPMNEIQRIADQHGLRLIEDCAHALGAKYRDQEVGSLGDAAFFSYGRDKVISSVAGGRATLKSQIPNPKSQMAEMYKKLNYPSRRWVLQQLLHPVTSEIILRTYHLGFGKALHFLLQKLGITTRANTSGEKEAALQPPRVPSKMPDALQLLLQEQFKRLDMFNQRRREIAEAYLTAGIKSAQPKTKGRIWLRFPILVDDPTGLHRLAKSHNIVLGDWYNQVVAPKGVDLRATGYKPGSCPIAEGVAGRIINLPTYPKMTDQDVARVIKLYNGYSSC